MELDEIMKKLQTKLTMEEIEFMPKTLAGEYALILAYKDARCDMKRLDEATGGLWQNEYRRDSKGILQCGIGIPVDIGWIWKWSNGVPSENEAEKGEYSDAFKRAGFMWGIGRELYDFPTLFCKVNADEVEEYQGKKKLSRRFKPQEWLWVQKDGRIMAVDKKNNERVNVKM